MSAVIQSDLINAKLTITVSGTDASYGYTIARLNLSAAIPYFDYLVTASTSTSTFNDYFYDSGVTYAAYVYNSAGTAIATYYPLYNVFDNTFLVGSNTNKGKQLSLIYDENISSFKPIRKDFVQETIGSKYPFVIRNAAINYKTMEFSGMIVAFMDAENVSGYGNSTLYSNYGKYVIQERNFRDWFEAFINDGYPKLLRSPSEGLRLVRITNVNFTPIRQVGRTIYNFSCTMTEIADPTTANFIKYKFI